MCNGLRGGAIATLVIKSRLVVSAAISSGKKTSCWPSKVNSPSAPVAAISAALAAACAGEPLT